MNNMKQVTAKEFYQAIRGYEMRQTNIYDDRENAYATRWWRYDKGGEVVGKQVLLIENATEDNPDGDGHSHEYYLVEA